MAYKVNGTTVIDNSRNVCACCVTSCCITASTRLDSPSGNTASRPGTPATGSLYFDTDLGALLSYNGTDWVTSGATTADPDDFGSPTWTYGVIGNAEIYCKTSTCCLTEIRQAFYDRCPNVAAHGRSLSHCVSYCYDNDGAFKVTKPCSNFITHLFRKGGGGPSCCAQFCCGYSCSQLLAGTTSRSSKIGPEHFGPHVCCNCEYDHGRRQVMPDGSLYFKGKSSNFHLQALLTCVQTCFWHEAYVTSKGGMIKSGRIGLEIEPICCNGNRHFVKEGMRYHPSYGPSTEWGPTIGYAMPYWCRPVGYCIKACCPACFIVCTNSAMYTNDEEVCDVAWVLPCCNLQCQSGIDAAGLNHCWKFIPCFTFGCIPCFSTQNCCYSLRCTLFFTTSRTDLPSGSFPNTYNKAMYTYEVYNCCGACIYKPDMTCCPMAIMSLVHLGNTNTCKHIPSVKCCSAWMYNSNGCDISIFKHLCVCCIQNKVWYTSTGCTSCYTDTFALMQTKVNRITCDVQNYVYEGWKCFLWWQCCKGCTYGTDPLGHCDGLGVCNSKFFCCMGLGSCARSEFFSQSQAPHRCSYSAFAEDAGYTPHLKNHMSGMVTSCTDVDRHYMIGKYCPFGTACSQLPIISVYCEATNTFECHFNFEKIMCGEGYFGDWLNLHFRSPSCIISCLSLCNGGTNFCHYINTNTATPWCCIADCITAITGCSEMSLARYCEGFNPFASRTVGQMYLCDDWNLTSASTSETYGFYINPTNDHFVFIGGFGLPACTTSLQTNRLYWIGAICFDLTNCCVSKVNVLWPSTKEVMNYYDCRVCACEGDNPASHYACFASYLGSRGYGCFECSFTKGIDVMHYGSPNFTDNYGGDCGGIILAFDGACIARTGALNCCVQFSGYCCSEYFGCNCTLACPEFQSKVYCCNKCVGSWFLDDVVSRLPYNCPFECIGWRSSTFYKNVFTWLMDGTKTYDPFGSDVGIIGHCYVFCENNQKMFPGFNVCNINTCYYGSCLKLCNSIRIICHDSTMCSQCGGTVCTAATLLCHLCDSSNYPMANWKTTGPGIYKNLVPCLIGDTENTTKLYSRCIRSTNRQYEGSLYNKDGPNFGNPYKFNAGEDHSTFFLRIWNEKIACIC